MCCLNERNFCRNGTMFYALKKIHRGHKFQDDCEVARSLITQDPAWYRQGVGKLVPREDRYLDVGWTGGYIMVQLYKHA
jgi:hypothetical protein